MPHLPPEWAAHLESGVSHRAGSCHADGRPEICRAVAAHALPDGRIELVFNRAAARELLQAVATCARVAYVASGPASNRTMHVKGLDAQEIPVTAAHAELMARTSRRFTSNVEPFGFKPEVLHAAWFDLSLDQMAALRFTPAMAWDQSPGPGAGQPIELLP